MIPSLLQRAWSKFSIGDDWIWPKLLTEYRLNYPKRTKTLCRMYEKWNEQSDIVNPAQCHGMSHSERHGVITLRCTPSQQQSPPRSLLYISSRGSPANLKLFEISMLVREERGGMVVGKTWICQRTTTTTTTTTTIAEQHWNRPFDEWKKLNVPNKPHISNRSSWPMFPGHWDPSVDGHHWWLATLLTISC